MNKLHDASPTAGLGPYVDASVAARASISMAFFDFRLFGR